MKQPLQFCFPILFFLRIQKMEAPSDLGNDRPNQPKNPKLEEIKFGSKNRKFGGEKWYKDFDWLERQAAFCFCCRKFGNETNGMFTKTGFKDWKTAREKGKGLYFHQNGLGHIKAHNAWKEAEMRVRTDKTISMQLVSSVVLLNRYYVKTIGRVCHLLSIPPLSCCFSPTFLSFFQAIKVLVAKELPPQRRRSSQP